MYYPHGDYEIKVYNRVILLQACGISGNRSTVIPGACLGCGLCVSTCTGKARRLVPRKNYVHEDILTTRILLGDQSTVMEDTK